MGKIERESDRERKRESDKGRKQRVIERGKSE